MFQIVVSLDLITAAVEHKVERLFNETRALETLYG